MKQIQLTTIKKKLDKVFRTCPTCGETIPTIVEYCWVCGYPGHVGRSKK